MSGVQIISAPSILGLKPTGVERLGESLLANGLAEKLGSAHPVIHVPTLNHLYSERRDEETNCLNTEAIQDFSLSLCNAVANTINKNRFALVLGGDCSILLGIMPALKIKGSYGIVFMDAHADFYEPRQSITGEVADMDLAILTGRGPEALTNINNLGPYVKDENVIHIGQRDWEETRKYQSQDIRETAITCISLADIEKDGIEISSNRILKYIDKLQVDGLWLHFDTDVLSDKINPAVDYRLPGGLSFMQIEYLIKAILSSQKIAGMSVAIFNPALDHDGSVSKNITSSLANAFDLQQHSK